MIIAQREVLLCAQSGAGKTALLNAKLIPILLYIQLGDCYRLSGNYDKAMQNIERAIELSPKDAYAYGVLGRVQFARNDHENAIDSAKRAIRVQP
ncbi:MAG: tetratricopeptide repeat protein [Candidatus Brocadia sp.]|nr:tetratricopeptide repeat protein [Candidatus Brocadia sp.]